MAKRKTTILVVDDEVSIVEVLKSLFRREGYRVKTACGGEEALELLQREPVDLMLSDIRMEPFDGLELLKRARDRHPHLAVIMMTAYADIDTAVKAVKQGAFHYISKPFKVDELLTSVQRALAYENVMVENESLLETLETGHTFRNMVGNHECMRAVYQTIEKVAKTDGTVLLRGESGTGKELVAKAIHMGSHRAAQPFIALNCTAVSDSLLESELFGHVRGAFTGANANKTGLFETAGGGTLFLDEVGSIPASMQLSLLRVLQEREIRPVGGTRSIPVDVRIVAATNENLEQRIQESLFRKDLFYRLAVIPIELPALRDRASDIPQLAMHFLNNVNEQEKRSVTITNEALAGLQAYSWPGNVRELENVITCAVTLCETDRITAGDLPDNIRSISPRPLESQGGAEVLQPPAGVSLKAFLRDKERTYIGQILKQCDGDKEGAAKALGISLATLYRKYGDG
ncbi:MAG: sigma-54-dependent Fis family transcriptional regulator [Lentisphaeria bacterium]|nr:sigma-54-dependent Fis family transcriptional regulator [Lentisphaeria bacterium]